jgi:hypothetical protein
LPSTPLRIFVLVWGLALLFAYVFFFEYLPPVRRVHVPYDLVGYHFPLNDFAFQQLRAGHWPQWDPHVYAGTSFASNVQAALYYPGTWLMMLANWGRERLSYQSLVDLDLVHVPLAFTLCFFWLQRHTRNRLATALGAMVYAYSGYMCLQLQHLGLIVAYAWLPLCLLGVDEAAESRSWRPLWKVAVGSALAFLGGYPPTWLVIATVVGVYALARRWQLALATVAALAFSLALCGVQTLPTWHATHFREAELRYGIGIKDPMFFLSYLIPNFWDFSMKTDVMKNLGREYLYLGAPGIVGVAWAFWRRPFRVLWPGVAVAAVCLVVATNPYALVWDSIKWSPLLAELVRSSYFLAGVTPALAMIAALGLDDFLEGRISVPAPIALGPILAWSGVLLFRWGRGSFRTDWLSAFDALGGIVVFVFAVLAYGESKARWVAIAMLLFAGVEYKAFGTHNRQNTADGQGIVFSSTSFGAMDETAYVETLRHTASRVLLHQFGPQESDLRHVGWRSPQGFDPFVKTTYRALINRDGAWTSDRNLVLDPMRLDVMDRFGVRFVMTAEQGAMYQALAAHPRYRMVGRNDFFYKVFEYLDAKSIYQFPGSLTVERGDADRRVLRVESANGGTLTFAENAFPGWHAFVDGRPVDIRSWELAFQAVDVPAGRHQVEFVYQERLLWTGYWVTAGSLLLLSLWIRSATRQRR